MKSVSIQQLFTGPPVVAFLTSKVVPDCSHYLTNDASVAHPAAVCVQGAPAHRGLTSPARWRSATDRPVARALTVRGRGDRVLKASSQRCGYTGRRFSFSATSALVSTRCSKYCRRLSLTVAALDNPLKKPVVSLSIWQAIGCVYTDESKIQQT